MTLVLFDSGDLDIFKYREEAGNAETVPIFSHKMLRLSAQNGIESP